MVTGALVGGALFMRLGTWLQHVDLRDNASLAEQWVYGNRSILGGLVGAWLGVHVAKRLCGYRLRTGDLFAPAVALGMAVGRIGCLLTELPGTPTGCVVGDHPRRRDGGPARRRRRACRCTRRSSTRSSSTSPRSPCSGSGCGTGDLPPGETFVCTSRRTACSGSSSSSSAATRSSGTA